MKRLSALLLAVAALMLAQFDPVRADGYYRPYRHHGVRVAYAGPDPAYDAPAARGGGRRFATDTCGRPGAFAA